MKRQRQWSILLTLTVLALIGWLTLRPSPEDVEMVARSRFWCVYPCDVEGLRDAILNILLFVPLGAALAGWVGGWPLWLTPVAVTMLVEFSQYQWLLGRDASLRDLLCNSLGGALGILVAQRWRSIWLPARPMAWAAGALLAWLAVVSGTAFGMRRRLPETTYWGQWAPVLGQFAIYAGTVLDIQVNGTPLPKGRAAHSGALRQQLLADSVLITATVVSGTAPNDPAPVASVFDSLQQEIFVLGQSHNDLIFRVRTGLVAAELGGQMLRLPDFPGHAPGDTVRITGGIVAGHYLLRAESGTARMERRTPVSAGWAWTGVLPFHYQLGPEVALVTALWLGALLVPAGYWVGASAWSRMGLLAIAATIGLGLAGATIWAGLPLAMGSEWLGSGAGAAVGWMLGRRLGRHGRTPARPG